MRSRLFDLADNRTVLSGGHLEQAPPRPRVDAETAAACVRRRLTRGSSVWARIKSFTITVPTRSWFHATPACVPLRLPKIADVKPIWAESHRATCESLRDCRSQRANTVKNRGRIYPSVRQFVISRSCHASTSSGPSWSCPATSPRAPFHSFATRLIQQGTQSCSAARHVQ